jgi:glycosyltransferase involved in cell wall biosynthesis
MRIYFEIGPLKEANYTGIAQVTAALAEQLLGDSSVDGHFFFGRMLVRKSVVEDLLRRRNGELLEWYLERALPRTAPHDLARDNVAVFPNRKTCRRGFARECQIVHDLSTLLTPQFHNQDTIDYHATTLESDIESNDITFCVSEATRRDVLSYFPQVHSAQVRTLHLAAAVDISRGCPDHRTTEPYILVLGTIEPRKNIAQVLRYVRDHSGFAKQHRFVFLGRFGWGASVADLLHQYGLDEPFAAGRLVFPGFVSEAVKCDLIRHAELVIYPSLFEGFGLPVLEAAALGVPCVTTRSSSLPESGGHVCYYFDPFIEGDFDRTLMKAILDVQVRRAEIAVAARAWAATFSWESTYSRMMTAIRDLLAGECADAKRAS